MVRGDEDRTGAEWVAWRGGSRTFRRDMVCPAGLLCQDPRTHGVSAGRGTDGDAAEVLGRRNMNGTEHRLGAGSCRAPEVGDIDLFFSQPSTYRE